MRFIAAIGLAALAASCAPKVELMDGNSNPWPTATRLAQGTDEIEAAASPAQTKPAVRYARSSLVRAQTVSARDQGTADAQSNLILPALRGQPNIATPAGSVTPSGSMQRDGEIATQATRVGAADRAGAQSLEPAQEAALSPARETASNEGTLEASACIRNHMKAAYQASETVDQATSFLMRTCFAPFSSAIASDEASAKTLFRGLVFQEISPVEWLKALEESPAKGR